MGIAERKEREKQQRREEIVQAAEEVFFSKGFEKSTMDDVAEKAELSKGTLYLYFKSKEELLIGIIEQTTIYEAYPLKGMRAGLIQTANDLCRSPHPC